MRTKKLPISNTAINNAQQLYDKLRKDQLYFDVEINGRAVRATHLGHNMGGNSQIVLDGLSGIQLEKEAVDGLFSLGHTTIFCDESKKDKKGNRLTSLDLILDGERVDIKSISKEKLFYGFPILGKNDQIRRYIDRKDTRDKPHSVLLYFHDPSMFSDDKIINGYDYFLRQCKENGYDVFIDKVICEIKGKEGFFTRTFFFK